MTVLISEGKIQKAREFFNAVMLGKINGVETLQTEGDSVQKRYVETMLPEITPLVAEYDKYYDLFGMENITQKINNRDYSFLGDEETIKIMNDIIKAVPTFKEVSDKVNSLEFLQGTISTPLRETDIQAFQYGFAEIDGSVHYLHTLSEELEETGNRDKYEIPYLLASIHDFNWRGISRDDLEEKYQGRVNSLKQERDQLPLPEEVESKKPIVDFFDRAISRIKGKPDKSEMTKEQVAQKRNELTGELNKYAYLLDTQETRKKVIRIYRERFTNTIREMIEKNLSEEQRENPKYKNLLNSFINSTVANCPNYRGFLFSMENLKEMEYGEMVETVKKATENIEIIPNLILSFINSNPESMTFEKFLNMSRRALGAGRIVENGKGQDKYRNIEDTLMNDRHSDLRINEIMDLLEDQFNRAINAPDETFEKNAAFLWAAMSYLSPFAEKNQETANALLHTLLATRGITIGPIYTNKEELTKTSCSPYGYDYDAIERNTPFRHNGIIRLCREIRGNGLTISIEDLKDKQNAQQQENQIKVSNIGVSPQILGTGISGDFKVTDNAEFTKPVDKQEEK